MKLSYGLILISLFLSSCAADSQTLCQLPPLKHYTGEQQMIMAQEINSLPANFLIIGALGDYARMRNQIRDSR